MSASPEPTGATGGGTTPPPVEEMAGGALGLCAIAMLRSFEAWTAKVMADDDDLTFINTDGTWDDLWSLGDQERTLLNQIGAPADA